MSRLESPSFHRRNPHPAFGSAPGAKRVLQLSHREPSPLEPGPLNDCGPSDKEVFLDLGTMSSWGTEELE